MILSSLIVKRKRGFDFLSSGCPYKPVSQCQPHFQVGVFIDPVKVFKSSEGPSVTPILDRLYCIQPNLNPRKGSFVLRSPFSMFLYGDSLRCVISDISIWEVIWMVQKIILVTPDGFSWGSKPEPHCLFPKCWRCSPLHPTSPIWDVKLIVLFRSLFWYPYGVQYSSRMYGWLHIQVWYQMDIHRTSQYDHPRPSVIWIKIYHP
jgi:hypothetical protein